jgi:ariadne-1
MKRKANMDDDDENYESDYAYSSGDEDGMDDDEGPALKNVQSSATAEISLLEAADLVPMMDSQIEEVANVIELPRVAVSALLRQYGWNKESLFDQYYSDPTKTKEKGGVDLWREKHSDDGGAASFDAEVVVLPTATAEMMCDICYSDVSAAETVASPCGHFFCTG